MPTKNVQLAKSDTTRLLILEKIYKNDGISLSRIKSTLNLCNITYQQSCKYLENIGAIVREYTKIGDRPVTVHHITDLGIAILVHAKIISAPKKETPLEKQVNMPLKLPPKNDKIEPIIVGQNTYPTPKELIEVYEIIKQLNDTAFYKEKVGLTARLSAIVPGMDTTITFEDLHGNTRIYMIIKKYNENYAKKNVDGLNIHLGMLYKEFQEIKEYLQHSRKFTKLLDRIFRILETINDEKTE